jgi:hypothetical protein
MSSNYRDRTRLARAALMPLCQAIDGGGAESFDDQGYSSRAM